MEKEWKMNGKQQENTRKNDHVICVQQKIKIKNTRNKTKKITTKPKQTYFVGLKYIWHELNLEWMDNMKQLGWKKNRSNSSPLHKNHESEGVLGTSQLFFF